jgi:hypothetical protein
MPPLIAAVAGAAAAQAFGAVIGTTAFANAIGTLGIKILTGVIGAVVSTAVGMLTAQKPKKAEPFTRQAQDRLQNIRSSIAPHTWIYGTAKVGGVQTYATSSGAGNQYIHVIVTIAGHEVTGIDSVFFNEDEITTGQIDASGNVTAGKYAGVARVKKYLGSPTQTADADLIAEAPASEWTSDHRGRGIAYLYVRLAYSADIYPGGVPNITAVVRGRALYDPRTGSTAFSNNAALCILDYLRSTSGLGIAADEWDSTWWSAQANLCDEDVAISASTTQKRYTIDGVFPLSDRALDIVERMMSSCVGALTYVDGRYKLHAAAYTAPAIALTTRDLRGPLSIIPRKPKAELFNAVRGTYVDPAQFWQPTDYPPVTNALYEAQDNGERIYRDVPFPFVTDNLRAQRLAKLILEKARQPITVRFPAKLTALRLEVWDVVNVTVAGPAPALDLGWTNKPFRVVSWSMAEDGGVDLVLQEEASGAYAWNYGEATTIDLAPDTSLATPFDAPPAITGLAAYSGDAELDVRLDGTIVSRVRVAWSAVSNVYVTSGGRIEVQFRQTGDATWRAGPPALGGDTDVTIPDVADGTQYDFRVRAVNSLSVAGPWVQLNGYTVLGKLAAPSAPSTFAVGTTADGIRRLSWTHISPPADVRAGGGYLIRYFLGSTSSWSAMTPLHAGALVSSPYETADLPAGTYTFAIKSRDSSGNESATALFQSGVLLPDPPLAGALLLRDEYAVGFPGTITSGFRDADGVVRASSTQNWTNLPGTWNGLAANWDTILTNATPLIYVTPTIDVTADLVLKPVVTVNGSGTTTIEMRTWKAGESEPGTWSALAQVTARYVKIRVQQAGTTPAIGAMTTIIDAPSVQDTINDLDVGAQATTTWFYRIAAGHFQVQPRNNIGALAMAQIVALLNVGGAWTWELVSKAATANATWSSSGTPPRAGFPIAEFKIRNAAGTLANAVIDISLRGPRT